MARTVAIGEQDFSKIIENQYFYVDKTYFIKEWWENGDTVTLITRPRRFGKTLVMNMLDCFFSFSYAGRSDLFENLSIWEEEKYRKLQGTYPVIFLSFAAVKSDNDQSACRLISRLVAQEYRRHAFFLKDDSLWAESKRFETVDGGVVSTDELSLSLNRLSEYLYQAYGKKVIILLDEYDTPMQEAYVWGYWKQLTQLIRMFMNATFKTNPFLERGIMTGITRVSKESIFSDLNNLAVVTTTSPMYEDAFGFTEKEVIGALTEFGLQGQISGVRRWYDGFRFGGNDHIYNPWSITNFLKYKELKYYWANTSSNRLAGLLILKTDIDTKLIMEELLLGNSFYAQVDEELAFNDLDFKKSAVWGLLLASGYLKVLQVVKSRRGKAEYELALTNQEARSIFDEMVTGWFSNKRLDYNDFSEALLAGDQVYMNTYINTIAAETFSYFDTGSRPSEFKQPENFFHGFVLGLIADLRELYVVSSNRESGKGRYDVMLKPRDATMDDGMILEFKVLEPGAEKSLEDTVKAALGQILAKNYVADLEAGCPRERIRVYGFAFRGKDILIGGGYLKDILQMVQM